MKNKKLMVTSKTFIIISVLSTILIVIATYSMLNKDSIDFSDLKVKKRVSENIIGNEIKLSKKKKTELISLLKKQSLAQTKSPVKCMIKGTYSINFGSYIIWFDKDGCTAYLTNKKHNDNYQIDLLDDIKNLIINLDVSEQVDYDFSNLKVEKRISVTTSDKEEIKLNEIAKTKLINLLKKQSLSETDNPVDCSVIGMYQISFDNYIIWFDKDGCTAYLTNKKHNDNYQIDLLDDIKGLIMNLDK